MHIRDLLARDVSVQERVRTGRFLVYFVLVYLLASGLVNALFPLVVIEELVARSVLGVLNALGISGTIVVQEPVLLQLGNANVTISELCTGLMELFIITAAILASHGIAWKKRLAGAAAALIVLFAFNLFRITATILVILSGNPLETIEFTHNVLFRVFLFMVIAGTYVAWFWLVTRQEKTTEREH